MTRFHINPTTGDPDVCYAAVGMCPFGILPAAHPATAAECRAMYERVMAAYTLPPPLKRAYPDPLR